MPKLKLDSIFFGSIDIQRLIVVWGMDSFPATEPIPMASIEKCAFNQEAA